MHKRHLSACSGLLTLITLLFVGCGGSSDNSDNPFFEDSTPSATSTSTTDATTASPSTEGAFTGDVATAKFRVLAVGDSNTNGFGVDQPWPDKLEIMLGQPVFRRGSDFEFSSGLLARLPAEIDETNPTHVCIMHGTNDAISQLDPDFTIANLAAMVDICNARNIQCIVGTLPPLIGADPASINDVRLAIDERIAPTAIARGARVARISEAFGEGTSLIIEDGIHMNDAGHALTATIFGAQIQ